jgi:hypothetical protein
VPEPSRERLYSARERFILTPAGRRRTFSRQSRNSKPLFRKRENMKDLLAKHGNAALRLLLIGSLAGAISCGDDQTSVPTDGTIQIVTNTEGIDFDPDGYLWSVNSSQGQRIGHQETVFVPALEPGEYTVTLSDMAENCTLPVEANPQTATVVPSDTVEVLFDVTCDLLTPPDDGGENPAVRGLQK